MLSYLLAEKSRLAFVFLSGAAAAGLFGAALGLLMPAVQLLLRESESGAGPQVAAVSWLPERLRAVVSPLLETREPFHVFLGVIGVICVFSLLGGITQYLQERYSAALIARVMAALRQAVFERLIEAPLLQLRTGGVSDKAGRLTADGAVIAKAYNTITGRPLLDVLRGLTALAIAFALHWQFTLLALGVMPVLILVLSRSVVSLEKSRAQALRRYGSLLALVQQSLSALHVVKMQQAEEVEKRRFGRTNRALSIEEASIGRIRAFSLALIETLSALAMAGLAAVSAWYVLQTRLEPARCVTVLIVLMAAAQSLRSVARASQELTEGRAAFRRLAEILCWPSEQALLQAEAGSGRKLKVKYHRDIKFEEVSFKYPGQDKPAVDWVTLTIGFGQTVALVGPNGAGKTTLLHLLAGLLRPDSGRVLVDGVSLADLDLFDWRRQVAFVPQEVSLLEGSIHENIAYGLEAAGSHQIVEAAKAACAHDFIVQLPGGYQSRLGEMGTGLSPGQKQRIAIARALLRDPRILILDEPTSQIDVPSEAAISETLARVARSRTVVVIAHRPETIRSAHLVVVMDQGRVSAADSHVELAARSELYRALVPPNRT
ncbi:MAG: ABC transporter ATP-binding protein [Acidobacteriota bacterium]